MRLILNGFLIEKICSILRFLYNKFMVIIFYNNSCFKIQTGDFMAAFDPPSKTSKYKTPRFQTDLIFISHNNENHNGRDVLILKEEDEKYIIDMPGEYEIKDVLIRGIESRARENQENISNTIFVLELEDIRICHMGDFSEDKLSLEIKEALGKIDMLFFPVGGSFSSAKKAAAIINEIEPSIVIPMHYDATEKKNQKLQEFLNEFSEDQVEKTDKLTIKKKDLSEEGMKVAVLQSNI